MKSAAPSRYVLPTVAVETKSPHMDESFDTDGAAAYIDCSAAHLIKMRGVGEGPPFHRLFKRKGIRYWRKDIDAWLATRRYSSTTEYPETLPEKRGGTF